MRCPFCNADDTKVIDSRLANEGYLVRRRRECLTCAERYTTFESAELVMPRIIKSDGSREPFNEDKLRSGFTRSLEKRPVSIEDIDVAITRIKRQLRSSGERELLSRTMGDWVMTELKSLDEVGYIRFASVYRSFQDLNEFREELDRLENEPTSEEKKRQMPLIPESQVSEGTTSKNNVSRLNVSKLDDSEEKS